MSAGIFTLWTGIRPRWFSVPPGVPMEFVPYMRLASIALTSTNVSDIQVGDRVLVVGLGVVGNFAAQFAQLQGREVLCAEVSRDRVEVARQCGLRHFVDPNEEGFCRALVVVYRRAGFDTVIEATGRTEVTSPAFAEREAERGVDFARHAARGNIWPT